MSTLWMSEINSKIKGRIALLSEDECNALAQVAAVPGDYVELGTLWGGTAVLAALAKMRANVTGHVYTVDFMRGGYWDSGDPSCPGMTPTEGAIYDNLGRFGVEERVTVVKASSYPWPLPATVKPSSVLIDCGHDYENCLRDWQSVRALFPEYVAFHDYSERYPGVSQVVNEITAGDDRYMPAARAGTLMVFRLKPEPEPFHMPKPVRKVLPKLEHAPEPVKKSRAETARRRKPKA